MTGAQVANIGLALTTTLVLSRTLGLSALGRWRFAQAATSYLGAFSDAGLTSLAIREIAKAPPRTDAFAIPVVAIQVLGAGLLYGALALLALSGSLPPDTTAIVMLLGLTVFPQALSLGHVLQGHERMAFLARIRVLAQLTWTVSGLALLLITRNLLWLVPPMLVAAMVSDAAILAVARRSYRISFRLPNLAEAAELVRHGAPFLIAAVAIQMIFNADALLLGWLRGDVELGTYAASYAVAGQMLLLAGPIMAAAFPRLSAHGGSEAGIGLVRQLMSLLGMIVLPVGLGVAATADLVLLALYGQSVNSTALILATLMTLPILGYYNSALGQTLGAVGHQKEVMSVALLSAAVNVGANLVLIPMFGIGGAAFAVVASEASTALLFTILFRRHSGAGVVLSFLESLPAAIAMLGALLLARTLGVGHLAVLVGIGMVVYAAGSFLMPSFARRELRAWRNRRITNAS